MSMVPLLTLNCVLLSGLTIEVVAIGYRSITSVLKYGGCHNHCLIPGSSHVRRVAALGLGMYQRVHSEVCWIVWCKRHVYLSREKRIRELMICCMHIRMPCPVCFMLIPFRRTFALVSGLEDHRRVMGDLVRKLIFGSHPHMKQDTVGFCLFPPS